MNLCSNDNDSDIAVIGISGRFPQADNLESFWKNLISGKDSIRPLPGSRIQELKKAVGQLPGNGYIKCGYLDSITLFEPEYFNISQEEARYIDPQQRLVLELVEEAVQDAGYNPERWSGKTIGTFLASSRNEYGSLTDASPMGVANAMDAAIAGRVAYTFNFYGPALTIDTTCSSSLVALHYARLSLLNDECDAAITGGVNIHILPPGQAFVEDYPIISKSQCLRAFDKRADGTLPGEGGGILVLKKLKKALADRDIVHAIIKGSGVNNNGRRSNGLSAPNQYAQAELMMNVIERSRVEAATISYIETHGTGTELGDPIEVEGMTIAFSGHAAGAAKRKYIPIGSVKTNIGHLGGAAGIAGVIKVILVLKHKKIPPSLHFQEPNPHIDFENSPVYVNDRLVDCETHGMSRASVTSLGLTGTNAYAILEEAPRQKQPLNRGQNTKNIFTLSARTENSMIRAIKNLKGHLAKRDDLCADDVAYTLNTGRRYLSHRLAVTADSLDELVTRLEWFINNDRSGVAENVYFNFADGDKNDSWQSVSAKFSPAFIYPGLEGEDILSPDELCRHKIFRTSYSECIGMSQPGLTGTYFAFQYAYSKLLIACGVEPKAVLGVGIGKHAADVIQGKIPLRQGLSLAEGQGQETQPFEESRLQEVIGNMLAKGHNLFLVIGGKSILGGKIGEILQNKKEVLYLNVTSNLDVLYSSLCQLYVHGFQVDWSQLYLDENRKRVDLPPYPFDRKPYFLEGDILKPVYHPRENNRDKENEGEKKEATFDQVLSILKSVLPRPNELRLDRGFEENGGDSISVMEAVEKIKKEYHAAVAIDLFYSISSLETLIESVLSCIRKQAPTRLVPYQPLIEEKPLDPSRLSLSVEMPENTLLTGATGFLGVHLLKELIQRTDAKIYALSRGDTPLDVQQHTRDIRAFYFGDTLEKHLNKRIFVVKGDITAPHLGLESSLYKKLADTVDTVIHCAADVRHHEKYDRQKKINVDGTQKMLDFCFAGRDKKLHHVSTLAVSGVPAAAIHFKENHLDIGQDFKGHVYGQTKFEAEILVNQAKSRGLNAAIYRIGNLTGRMEDGVFQRNIASNAFYNYLKAIIILGKFPSSLKSEQIEMTPVDLCSRSMVNLLLLKGAISKNFHLMNPHFLTIRTLCDSIREFAIPLEEVDDETFSRHVREEVDSRGFVKEISRVFYGLREEDSGANSPVKITYDAGFTVKVLARTGFTWPELNPDYLSKIVKHCVDVGYISLKTGGTKDEKSL